MRPQRGGENDPKSVMKMLKDICGQHPLGWIDLHIKFTSHNGPYILQDQVWGPFGAVRGLGPRVGWLGGWVEKTTKKQKKYCLFTFYTDRTPAEGAWENPSPFTSHFPLPPSLPLFSFCLLFSVPGQSQSR